MSALQSLPSQSKQSLSITASAYQSFKTPGIAVPFPSVYGNQVQIPFNMAAGGDGHLNIGGKEATSGIASESQHATNTGAVYKDSFHWPDWATGVIAGVGGFIVLCIIAILVLLFRAKRKQKLRRYGLYPSASTDMNRNAFFANLYPGPDYASEPMSAKHSSGASANAGMYSDFSHPPPPPSAYQGSTPEPMQSLASTGPAMVPSYADYQIHEEPVQSENVHDLMPPRGQYTDQYSYSPQSSVQPQMQPDPFTEPAIVPAASTNVDEYKNTPKRKSKALRAGIDYYEPPPFTPPPISNPTRGTAQRFSGNYSPYFDSLVSPPVRPKRSPGRSARRSRRSYISEHFDPYTDGFR